MLHINSLFPICRRRKLDFICTKLCAALWLAHRLDPPNNCWTEVCDIEIQNRQSFAVKVRTVRKVGFGWDVSKTKKFAFRSQSAMGRR